MNYSGRGSPRSPEHNGRGGSAWELGSDAGSAFGGGGGGGSVCCFEHLPSGDPGDGSVPLALLRGEPGLHLGAPSSEDRSHPVALDPCLSDENYDFSSAESGSSLRYYSEGESGGGGSSSSLHASSPQAPLGPANSGGGLYEVDVVQGECYPVYWNQADKIPVMRGQWFIDGTWQPLEEEESNLIEQEHLNCFRGRQMEENFDIEITKSIDGKDAIHSFKLSRNHVDWHSMDEVYLYSDATTSKIARTVTQKLGFSKASSSGTRLHRGYVEEASLEDKPSQTTHIVFVVHGIGQKMDQGRIIKNTAMMREAARKIEERHFSNHATHVEFLPVEWRSKLTLDGDTVDSITPDKVRGLRDMLNSSAMDIMYYTSPLYRDELVKGLQQELNRLYSLFCSRNPDFEEKGGKVSIVSHSLGCVITYDIMTGWNPVRLYEQLLQKEEELPEERWMSYEERNLLDELYITKRRLREIEERLHGLKASSVSQAPALKFKVENFFCMGSPLAVFLALRGIRPGNTGSQDHILPREICNRLLNIFHPTDPVAYRLEPLILKHYSNISPVQIHWYNTSNPLPYEHMKPSFLHPAKEATSVSDNEGVSAVSSPVTSPVLSRRHYSESITNIGKASILGAASIGKGLGGMLFSRFGRSSTSQSSESSKDSMEDEKKPAASPSATTVATQTLPQSSSGLLDSAYFRLQESFLYLPQLLFPENVMQNKDNTLVELDHRIDFELREGLVESRYWSAVTSHTAYWSSLDVALFLLTFMYKHERDNDAKPNLDPI
ncbi:phospholipase DDHD1 isoform X5 [Ochotona curzoniae]|uniref:phospholipase DDHD1 isoform X5 n=1 Tax=Ochotona curzoniae TaxID=130825 RepID=UPI001B349B0F|nr:phospholipase DDHD1 isoform X5 [Ochotona curzoniae]XP_040853941.1 phospholipase DDHD1 isoform X5 [Ochotona curzoniae]